MAGTFGHESPATRARELLKAYKDSASLLVEIEKKVFHFRFGVLWGGVTSGGVFAFYWPP